MKKFWRERNLGIVLLVLFLASWLLQGWAGWQEFQAEQQAHAQAAQVFGQDGYVWAFWQATLENWQSEFLQLLSFVVLTSFLVFRGSPESRDDKDEIAAALSRIESRLGTLPPPPFDARPRDARPRE